MERNGLEEKRHAGFLTSLTSLSWSAIVLGLIVFAIFISLLTMNFVAVQNTKHNCVSIEALKSRVRVRAKDDYKKLDENAALLGITVTPQLREAELKSLHRVLKDYAPDRCVGFFG